MRVLRSLWRLLRALLLGLAALVVFIEEFGWRPLSAWLGRIARWPPLHALEARIRQLPARPALGLFMVPAVLLFPIKLAALGLLHAGHAATGLGIIVAAKLLGTAVVGRLFMLLEPQLREFAWVVRALEWWGRFKTWIAVAVRESRFWRAVRAFVLQSRSWVKRRLR